MRYILMLAVFALFSACAMPQPPQPSAFSYNAEHHNPANGIVVFGAWGKTAAIWQHRLIPGKQLTNTYFNANADVFCLPADKPKSIFDNKAILHYCVYSLPAGEYYLRSINVTSVRTQSYYTPTATGAMEMRNSSYTTSFLGEGDGLDVRTGEPTRASFMVKPGGVSYIGDMNIYVANGGVIFKRDDSFDVADIIVTKQYPELAGKIKRMLLKTY